MKYKIRVATSVASLVTFSVALPAGVATAEDVTLAQPRQSTYAGGLNRTRTGGATTTCVHQPDTSAPMACSLTFTLTMDICVIKPTATNVGLADYSAYNGRFTSNDIPLHGNGTRVGVLVGTAFVADEGRFIKVSIDATDACDEARALVTDLADGTNVPNGKFTGEATYTVSSSLT